MLERGVIGCGTLGADRGYDTRDFVAELRARAWRSTTVAAAAPWTGAPRGTPGTGRARRRRKIVEQVFGWIKTVGGGRKLRFVGCERNRCWLELTAAAYNLVRMARLEDPLRRRPVRLRPAREPSEAPVPGQEATIRKPEAASSRLSPLRDTGWRFFSTMLVSRVVIATYNGYGAAQRGFAPWGRLWSVMSTRIGRPTVAIVLSGEERETLERWARRPTSAQALALRCRIVLAAAEGTSNKAIAAVLDCHPVTVGKWRRRFAQWRLDGLQDEPRPGAPRTITDAQVEAVIVTTLEEQPPNATHWSTRSMAAALGMSQSAISRILARLRPEAAPRGELQAVARPAVHRQGS